MRFLSYRGICLRKVCETPTEMSRKNTVTLGINKEQCKDRKTWKLETEMIPVFLKVSFPFPIIYPLQVNSTMHYSYKSSYFMGFFHLGAIVKTGEGQLPTFPISKT